MDCRPSRIPTHFLFSFSFSVRMSSELVLEGVPKREAVTFTTENKTKKSRQTTKHTTRRRRRPERRGQEAAARILAPSACRYLCSCQNGGVTARCQSASSTALATAEEHAQHTSRENGSQPNTPPGLAPNTQQEARKLELLRHAPPGRQRRQFSASYTEAVSQQRRDFTENDSQTSFRGQAKFTGLKSFPVEEDPQPSRNFLTPQTITTSAGGSAAQSVSPREGGCGGRLIHSRQPTADCAQQQGLWTPPRQGAGGAAAGGPRVCPGGRQSGRAEAAAARGPLATARGRAHHPRFILTVCLLF